MDRGARGEPFTRLATAPYRHRIASLADGGGLVAGVLVVSSAIASGGTAILGLTDLSFGIFGSARGLTLGSLG
jgi:hypothetical protein